MSNDIKERIEKALALLGEAQKSLEVESNRYNSKARNSYWAYVVSRGLIAALGVATPVLVTYQTQNPGSRLGIFAILLTAVTGALTTVHAIFRWGDNYVRAKLTSLSLEELLASTRLKRYRIEDTPDQARAYQEAFTAIEQSHAEKQKIIRRQIESEISVITQEKEESRNALLPPAEHSQLLSPRDAEQDR